MVVKVLKKTQFSALFLIVLLSLAEWLPSLLHAPKIYPTTFDSVSMPLYRHFIALTGQNPLVGKLIALALTFTIGIYILNINGRYMLVKQRSYLPLLFYVFLSSAIVPLQRLLPVIPAMLFTVGAFDYLLGTYQKKLPLDNLYRTGILISLATLFYAPAIFLVIWLFIGLAILRPFRLREWLVVLVGIATPWFFWIFYCYWYDYSTAIPAETVLKNISVETNVSFDSLGPLILILFLAPALLASLFRIFHNLGMQKISIRKFQNILLWLLLFSIFLNTAIPQASYELTYLAAVPLSLFTAAYFVNCRSRFWSELLFALMASGWIALQLIYR